MKRQIADLRVADYSAVTRTPDGIYLARIRGVQYRKFVAKPFFTVALAIVEPPGFGGNIVSSRIYCNRRALWKLSWFLRDFGYDKELLEVDEVDEQRLVGLVGVVKISNVVYDGMSLIRFEGFAQAKRWKELSPAQNFDEPTSR
jgi:hypothetical protein